MSDKFAKIAAGTLVCIAMGAFLYRSYRQRALTVLAVDTALLTDIKGKLLTSLFQMSCEVFAGSSLEEPKDRGLFERQASTLYSLFKQIKEGDADDFEQNRARTTADK